MAAGDASEITLMTDVKVSELAAVLGLSANRIHQLAKTASSSRSSGAGIRWLRAFRHI